MHLKLYLNQKLLHRPSLESMCLNACADLNNVIELYVFNDLKVKVNIQDNLNRLRSLQSDKSRTFP